MNKSYSILLVDDDKEDAQIFIEIVSEIDNAIKCMTAIDGHDALKILSKENASLPDIIFLDLNMPRLGGKQFLIEKNKIKRLVSIPVIIYTTTKRIEDIEETKKLGAFDFLTKPIKYEQIRNSLTDILEKVRAHTYH